MKLKWHHLPTHWYADYCGYRIECRKDSDTNNWRWILFLNNDQVNAGIGFTRAAVSISALEELLVQLREGYRQLLPVYFKLQFNEKGRLNKLSDQLAAQNKQDTNG